MNINTVDVSLFEARAKLAETQIETLTNRLAALTSALAVSDNKNTSSVYHQNFVNLQTQSNNSDDARIQELENRIKELTEQNKELSVENDKNAYRIKILLRALDQNNNNNAK